MCVTTFETIFHHSVLKGCQIIRGAEFLEGLRYILDSSIPLTHIPSLVTVQHVF